jgi:hypothetical protein
MVAYLAEGQQFHPEVTQDELQVIHIGENFKTKCRVITVQMDGDELAAFKWGMANYNKAQHQIPLKKE